MRKYFGEREAGGAVDYSTRIFAQMQISIST